MKTAIILINKPGDGNHPANYLTHCAEKVRQDGMVLIHTYNWYEYRDIDIQKFINKMIRCIDVFYLFVDYGISPIMMKTVEKYYFNSYFTKKIKVELANHNRINLDSVLKEVSAKTGISLEDMKSKCRKREFVEARQFYFKLAKNYTKASYALIGSLVSKDHATTMHGIQVVDTVKELRDKYEILFEGKKPVVKDPPVNNVEKSLLIGRVKIDKDPIPEPFKRPFEHTPASNNLPYHGYRPHSL